MSRDVTIDEGATYEPGEEESFFPWTEQDNLAIASLMEAPAEPLVTQIATEPVLAAPFEEEIDTNTPDVSSDEPGEEIELPQQADRPTKKRDYLPVPEGFQPLRTTRSRGA